MISGQIRQVRSFNRAITQRIGALNASFLDRGRPLGEARLLYEIGQNGAEVRRLRRKLGVDSGYLSRLLRSLERQGLIRTQSSAADARVRRAILTSEGRAELAEYDSRSDAFARGVLASLGAAQRDRLVTAMADVERLLAAAAVEMQIEPPESADAVWCLDQYFRELEERFESGYDPSTTRSATAHELTPPAGCFVVARLDGEPVGCGALKIGTDKIGEIKRMWVDRSVRGLGVGRRIIETLEEHARKYGSTIVRLDTNRALTEAQALYRACGYREVAPFNDELYADHWFEKNLTAGSFPHQSPSLPPSHPRREGGSPRRRGCY